jgi:hypothetical protein
MMLPFAAVGPVIVSRLMDRKQAAIAKYPCKGVETQSGIPESRVFADVTLLDQANSALATSANPAPHLASVT